MTHTRPFSHHARVLLEGGTSMYLYHMTVYLMSPASSLFMGFSFTDVLGVTKHYEPTCAHFGFGISPAINCAYNAMCQYLTTQITLVQLVVYGDSGVYTQSRVQ